MKHEVIVAWVRPRDTLTLAELSAFPVPLPGDREFRT
jgi:hypothetical protein